MDNYGGSGGGGPNSGGFPMRNSRAFNDPSGSSAERIVQPVAQYANSNGILSRSGAREDGGGGGGAGRTQQPSHEVFMVREANRGNSVGGGPSANRFQADGGSESTESRQVLPVQSSTSSGTHSSSHHKDQQRGERDRERDHRQQQLLPLPKMLKIAVVGESTSGKTAICNAFTSEGYNFSRNYHMTTGVSIYAKSVKLPSNRAGGDGDLQSGISSGPEDSIPSLESRINLVLVDSAGKSIYKELLPQYWDRLDGVALVIDLTSTSALETATEWLNLARGSIQKLKNNPPSDGSGDQGKKNGGGDRSSILGVLIGSKTDLKDQRVISPKAAQDFASEHGLQYYECSAKDNSGMEEPFFYLAHQWALSTGAPSDKENASDGEFSTSSSTASGGGIFAMGRSSNGSSSNSNSKRSAFATKQGSSSEPF